MRKAIKTIATRAAEHINSPVTPHVLRHTFATNARNNGMEVENIQTLLGHKKYETTMRYIDYNNNGVKFQHERFVV